MSADARRGALAGLEQAIMALAPHMISEDDKAALARLQAEVVRLGDPAGAASLGLRSFDDSRLQHLIGLTGPTMAGTFLMHLANDLARCRSQAIAGVKGPDWDALRQASHIVISLAGSTGAFSLQDIAEALHSSANAEDGATAQILVPDLVTELDALIALVRATPVPAGGAS